MIIGFVQNAINAIYRKIKNRKIIFYITDTTVQVAYYKKDELIDSYISKSENLKTDLDFVEYLHKRKKSNAKFIVQSRQITSEKISIPILGTFGNINPIENYCLTHLTPDMLYTYKVHAITKDRSEIWKSTVSYMPFTEKVSQCFELLYQNHTPFFGLYFHKVIADQIVTLIGEENKINLENYIYAIICILNEEELSLNLFHAGNILHSSIVTIPKNESDNYLSGLVDQTLQDSWIKFKSYIQHEKLSKLSIFLVNNNLKRLLIGSKKNDELYIFPEDSTLENPFQIFIHYFFKSRQLPAINQAISQYKRYRKVDSMIFPPLYIIFGSAILCILYINMLAYYNNNITSYLYKEYTKITEEIREAGKSYPETKNLIQLADLYYAQEKLSNNKDYPFKVMEKLITILKAELVIDRLFWLNRDNSLRSNIVELDVSIEKDAANSQTAFIEESLQKLRKDGMNFKHNISRRSGESDNIGTNQTVDLRISITNID